MTTAVTVGSLLAEIANGLSGALRMMMFADKRQWGPDEFEQVRALEDALDEAKRDFQQLAVLVNGQYYYENDRNGESGSEAPFSSPSPHRLTCGPWTQQPTRSTSYVSYEKRPKRTRKTSSTGCGQAGPSTQFGHARREC